MKLVIEFPDNLFPALVSIAHAADKPAEKLVEDHILDSVKQRLYHLRNTGTPPFPGVCGFQPNNFRGDRPALSLELFLQAEPPQRRCPECMATLNDNRAAKVNTSALPQKV